MTKEEITTLFINEINEKIKVDFRGAELSYNKQQFKWRIAARFYCKQTTYNELSTLFKNSKIQFSHSKLTSFNTFSAIHYYNDKNPS